jgi:DNA adenine methylase
MKTPISYYGGKQNLTSKIIPLIPENIKVYCEPFFGGGAIFFALKNPATEIEIINDTNNMVTNFYEVVKTDFDNLKQKVEATLFSRATYSVANTMYRMPHLFDKLQLAWAFFVATNMGFSNKIGSWGLDKYGKRVKAFRNKKLRFDESVAKRLEKAQIESKDAVSVIETYNTEDTFFYCDPPYIDSNQGHYGGYTESDYRRLLDALVTVKGKFILSSYPSNILDEYIQKYGWISEHVDKPLSASKFTDKPRKRKIEVITRNYSL